MGIIEVPDRMKEIVDWLGEVEAVSSGETKTQYMMARFRLTDNRPETAMKVVTDHLLQWLLAKQGKKLVAKAILPAPALDVDTARNADAAIDRFTRYLLYLQGYAEPVVTGQAT